MKLTDPASSIVQQKMLTKRKNPKNSTFVANLINVNTS